ncbi:chorismate mutase [Pseudomonas otitidis]|uniref:chorismate mutase n=1 Tax=Metapseudomonas otitidis TaxID=319939 RepID=UPI0024AE4232|nr:chorismate mutase [Pseudomonas otitidis]MDI6527788.1 chorismate mutase [Pseudomonas otitidis]
MVECQSIEQVREEIDALDRRIVQLLAERSGYVRQAARFKTDADAVRAPQRVEQVIAKVRALAAENGAPVEVIEQVYRAMINAFIDAELAEHAALNPSA